MVVEMHTGIVMCTVAQPSGRLLLLHLREPLTPNGIDCLLFSHRRAAVRRSEPGGPDLPHRGHLRHDAHQHAACQPGESAITGWYCVGSAVSFDFQLGLMLLLGF